MLAPLGAPTRQPVQCADTSRRSIQRTCYYRDEHRCHGKGYDDPTQAGTGLTLHEFVGGLPTMLYISSSGKIVHTVSGVISEPVMLKYIEDAASTH